MEFHERLFANIHIIIVELRKETPQRNTIMTLTDAIAKRIREICEERKINVCDASLKGGMSPSALYDLLKGRTKCSKVITVKRFCEGAGITLSEFFARDYFNDPED